MQTEMNELMEQLQGHWKLDNDEQNFEIKGNEITIFTKSKSVKTSFELKKNLQLGNWQIKVLNPLSWQRTFVVNITPDTFTLYDFDLHVQIAMRARTKLLNPTRVYKYARVAVEAEV
jgi:hypothetical protein